VGNFTWDFAVLLGDGAEKSTIAGNLYLSIIAERGRNSVASVVPEAGLFHKCNARTAKLCYLGHVLMGNEHGVIIAACVSEAGPEPSPR
jgi:hypothetical protein